MRFLIDECTGPAVAAWLRGLGHEVFSIYDEARGMDDDSILGKAHAENWILITNDKEFGEKIVREGRPHCGVVLLRLANERAANKISTLGKLLQQHAGEISSRFVIVSESRIRFAKS